MSSLNQTHLTKFLSQLASSSDPQNLIAQRYFSLTQTHQPSLEYCQLYLYHIELINRIEVERKQIGALHQEIESVFGRFSYGVKTPKRETMIDCLSTKQGRLLEGQGQCGKIQRFVFQQIQQHEADKGNCHEQSHNKVHQTDQKPIQNNNCNKVEESPNTTNPIKRARRPAQSISRHWLCPNESCGRRYGSEGSLKYHIKLKHLCQMEKESSMSKLESNRQGDIEEIEEN